MCEEVCDEDSVSHGDVCGTRNRYDVTYHHRPPQLHLYLLQDKQKLLFLIISSETSGFSFPPLTHSEQTQTSLPSTNHLASCTYMLMSYLGQSSEI